MKIAIIKPESVNVNPWIPEFRSRGIDVRENMVEPDCDFIICASHSQIAKLEYFHSIYPEIPIINYNWDLYGWVFDHPRGYDWHKYGEYLKKSTEIWCPSEEVVMRSEEFFGVGNKCEIIHTFARFFDADTKDGRYVLQPMRAYTKDKNYGFLRRATQELQIPLVETNHRLNEEEFQKTISECSFMCTEYHEASTGGLTLLEGYRIGKPVVISDSLYMGARDYFGDKAIYFKDGDYESIKRVIKEVWDNTPALNLDDCKELTDRYKLSTMVDKMINRLERLMQQ